MSPESSWAQRAALVLVVLAASALLAFRWTYEPDLFWHLAQGREIAAGHFVRTNLFSATHPDYVQPSISWLFDVGSYALWSVGGATAIQIGQTLVVAVTLLLVAAAAQRRGAGAAALAVVGLGLFVIEPRALPRPHTVSLAGMAACALLIEQARARRSPVPLIAVIPLIAVWSNLHVESFFGVLLIGLFAAGEFLAPSVLSQRQALAAGGIAIVAAAATIVNPYGVGLLRYLWENTSVPSVIRIAELQPPYLPNYAAFFAYLVALVTLLLRRPSRLALWEGFVVVAFAALALRHLRFTAQCFCATAPIFAGRLAPWVRDRRSARSLALVGVLVGLLLARLPATAYLSQLAVGEAALVPPDMFPVGAAAFCRRVGLTGPVFNSNNIGGYLIWAGYPDVRVFQDSRLQAYPPDHFRQIMAAYRSQPDWDTLVAGVDWAVLSSPRPNELSGAGRFPRSQWATVYWDDAAEVLVRRASANGARLAEYEYRAFLPESDPFAAPKGDGASYLKEVRRNAQENPSGFAARAALCLQQDAAACDDAERFARDRPGLRRFAGRLRGLRR